MNNGWIKLYRCLMDKPIWLNSTPEQKVILITILMLASHVDKEWEWQGNKFTIKPGQFVTSLPKLAEKCGEGISIQNVRTALKRFKKLEFLTDESTATGRLITVENWGIYQGKDDEHNSDANSQLTDSQQTPNRRLTPIKNDKNNKNDKKDKKHIYGEYKHVRLTDEEMNRLVDELGEDGFSECVRILDEYKEQSGKTYKNDNLAIRNWVIDRYKENISKQVDKPKEGRLDWLDDWGR